MQSNRTLQLVREFKKYRMVDGFFKDGIEAIAIAIRHVRSNDDLDTCYIDLPGNLSVCVEFNGGVPCYLVKENALLGNWNEVTRSRCVSYLEGNI